MQPKSLVDLAILSIGLGDLKFAPASYKKVFAENFVPLCERDTLFAEGLKEHGNHVCSFDKYKTWFGGLRTFREAAKCGCECDGIGNLCKCECAVIIKKLIEFKLKSVKKYKAGDFNLTTETTVGDIVNGNFAYIERKGFNVGSFRPF